MIGFPLGLLYANAGEWFIHKYVLHGLGRNKASFWSYHWHEHHRNARRNGNADETYLRSPFQWNAQGKELMGVLGLSAAHLPLLPIAPFFTVAVWYSAWRYYHVHRRAHVDPAWAREHLPWHVDHHLGPNQDANWCVTWPFFDWIMGTSEPSEETGAGTRGRKTGERGGSLAAAL